MAEVNVSLIALHNINYALKEFRTDNEHLSTSVSKHIQELLSFCEDEIRRVENEISDRYMDEKDVKRGLEYTEKKISDLENRIYDCESSISNLQNQAPHDKDDFQSIQKQIGSYESELKRYRPQLKDAADDKRESEEKLLKIKEMILEKEHKLVSMKSEYSNVQKALSDLASKITEFCRCSGEQNNRDISNVNLCIRCLEQYLSNNL